MKWRKKSEESYQSFSILHPWLLFLSLIIIICLMLIKCKNLVGKVHIEVALSICAMLIKVNNLKT